MQTRIEFQNELKALHEQIIRMGTAVEKAIGRAVEALRSLDTEIAREVIAGDDLIDEMEREIDRRCVRLIALQQPVARDLRDVTANLKLITDLERIADQAVDICRHVKAIADAPVAVRLPEAIDRLADLTCRILKQALDAYVARDRGRALEAIRLDDVIDERSRELRSFFVDEMEKDTSAVAPLVELVMVSNHFERAGDHAQNVAEWVIYYIDGRRDNYEEEEQSRAAKADHHR